MEPMWVFHLFFAGPCCRWLVDGGGGAKRWSRSRGLLYGILFLLAVGSASVYHEMFIDSDSTHPPSFFRLLRVDIDATPADIKAAYKARSLELHPDKNRAPDAAEQFLRLQQAYETLMDASLRVKYSRFGEKFLKVGTADLLQTAMIASGVFYIVSIIVIYFLCGGE